MRCLATHDERRNSLRKEKLNKKIQGCVFKHKHFEHKNFFRSRGGGGTNKKVFNLIEIVARVCGVMERVFVIVLSFVKRHFEY